MEITIRPEHESPRALLALAAMLTTLAGQEIVTMPPADNPAAGADTLTCKASPAITGPLLRSHDTKPFNVPREGADLAAAFGGAGNVVGGSPIALSPPPALIGATSPNIQTATSAPAAAPDLAAAFGANSGPNVAPLTLPSGAPPVPPNGAPTAGESIPVDAEGLPWDARIHSSNGKKAATGIWMARRGVDPLTANQVKAQIRAAMSVGNAPAPTRAPPPPVTLTPPPLAATTPATAASDAVITLPMLLPRITTAMAAGHLTAETAAAIAMELSGGKINNVAMLAIAPQLIPGFWARLDQLGIPS